MEVRRILAEGSDFVEIKDDVDFETEMEKAAESENNFKAVLKRLDNRFKYVNDEFLVFIHISGGMVSVEHKISRNVLRAEIISLESGKEVYEMDLTFENIELIVKWLLRECK